MGYLKNIWHRQYQLIVMSEDGGWSRSHLVIAGRLLLIVLVVVLVLLGLFGASPPPLPPAVESG